MSTETEMKDPNVGRVIEWGHGKKGEARTATIIGRMQTHYKLDASDGTAGWISVENLARQDRRAQQAATGGVSDASASEGTAFPFQERIERIMRDLDLIRAGKDPEPMTADERARILARCAGDPKPDLEDNHAKRVDLAQRIEANVARLNEQRKQQR